MAVSESDGLQRGSRLRAASSGGLCLTPRRLRPFLSVGKCAELGQVRVFGAVEGGLWSVTGGRGEKWFNTRPGATGGHRSTFFGLPAPPQARSKGQKGVEPFPL